MDNAQAHHCLLAVAHQNSAYFGLVVLTAYLQLKAFQISIFNNNLKQGKNCFPGENSSFRLIWSYVQNVLVQNITVYKIDTCFCCCKIEASFQKIFHQLETIFWSPRNQFYSGNFGRKSRTVFIYFINLCIRGRRNFLNASVWWNMKKYLPSLIFPASFRVIQPCLSQSTGFSFHGWSLNGR